MKFEIGDVVEVVSNDNPFCGLVKVGYRGEIVEIEESLERDDCTIDILFNIPNYGDLRQTVFSVNDCDYLKIVYHRPDTVSRGLKPIEPLKLTEEFKVFMKYIRNKKEKKTMDMDIDIEKIIFNKPATILYANGERYVTKAYNEEFDSEKGLAISLLKAFGISYLDLQRLIKSATVQEKKAPKKKVETKVDKSTPKTEKPKKKCIGRVEETVEVTNSEGQRYTIHKGRKRGVGQKIQFGDTVLVRLCKFYEYEEVEQVREVIGRPLKVVYVGENTVRCSLDSADDSTKKSYEFLRNEIDRI